MTTPAPAPYRTREWKRAWTALRSLMADPQRTDQVFEIIDALAGPSYERQYQRFTANPAGRRLLAEKPSLIAALSDRERLRALPEGSFGRAYLAFMDSGGLTADGLVAADEMASERNPSPTADDPDRQYFGDRLRDMHDLWHVLTGYGMDEAGEAANLAFTYGQIPSAGIALIVLAAAVEGPKAPSLSWQRYLYRAWRRGRRAAQLPLAPYEELLPQPLDEVRRRLGIDPPHVAHPEGIIVANRDDEEAGSPPASGWQGENEAARA
ncbi:MAG TPA: Coq4 family protein [Candidatus Binatia bacterium]|nr:Coq4 family protein [Candidatus Binatia bacterium]